MDSDLKNFLKENALMWLEIENKSKELKRQIKENKETQKKIESDLVSIMGEYKIEDLTTKNGSLKYKITNTKEGFSKKFLLLALQECLGDSDKANDLFENIDKKRNIKTKVSITQRKGSLE